METFWHQRPKISSFSADQSFTDLEFPSNAPSSFRGNKQLQNQKKFPKSASNSSSCRSNTADEDQLTFEWGWRSSKKSTGTPMKKLLAQEMSKENESRRRPSSVIARLMGLDGLPPQQSGHKQQRRAESSQEKVPKGGTFYSRRSSRNSSMEEPEFKDVFEVLDSSKAESGGYSSQGTGRSKISDAEVAFIQQKFMEAKRLSTDEKFLDSEEFNDTLEVLDSNSDLLVKFLQQPDSLFTKHLHDLHGLPPQSHCGRISAMKLSHTLKNNENCPLDRRAGRETQLKPLCKAPQRQQENPLIHSYGRYAACNPPKSPKVQLDEINGPSILPTKIVVLKPNIGKLQNSARTASSACSYHFPSGCGGQPEILGIESRETEIWGKKRVHQDIDFSRHNSRESREMAKEITRQMKNNFSNGSMKISTSRLRGYAGDESSCDLSGSESADDSDVMTAFHRDNVGWNKRHRRSSSHSSESSVSREAKKRLSERWKLTHGSQKVQMVSRGSTLGEMLAISDRKVSPASSSGLVGGEGCSKTGTHAGPAVCNEPLGISSRDGWKDGCLGNLSRSRSLPASTNFGNPRISIRHDNLRRDNCVVPNEGFKWGRNKAVKGYFNQLEAPLPSNQRSLVKKSQFSSSSCSSNKETSDTSPDFHITHHQIQQNFEGDNQSEHSLTVSGESAITAVDSTSVLENAVDVNVQDNAVLSKPTHMELSAPGSVNADLSSGGVYNLDSQEPPCAPSKQAPLHCTPELESRASSKEADQPSPVSVIEAPFTDDLSSGSECFESISADLHGLRMQLQLLKLESGAYEEGTMLLSSDDDGDEVPVALAEDKGTASAKENWESVYIVDVLVESGIHGADLDTFLATWHSPERPLNPSVFEDLEKKFHNLNSWSRAERRLMFDRINSKLLEIYEQFMDQHPWRKSVRKIIPEWNIRNLEDSLHKSLVSENKKLDMDAGEYGWLDLREDIDVIGWEIERLLVDELVAEVLQS